MQARLRASSAHEHLVLYDPAAIPVDTPVDPDLEAQDPELLPEPAIRRLVELGQALVVRIPTEDCQACLGVFVNEEPPSELRSAGEVIVSGARLRLPEGVLRADGLEFLCRPGEDRPHSFSEEASVPSGDFTVEVLDLIRWKEEHRRSEVLRDVRWWHLVVHRLIGVFVWLFVLLLPANLLVAPLAVFLSWRLRGWHGVAVALAATIVIDVIVIASSWVLSLVERLAPGLFLITHRETAFERDHPDLVIVLQSGSSKAGSEAAAFGTVRLG